MIFSSEILADTLTTLPEVRPQSTRPVIDPKLPSRIRLLKSAAASEADLQATVRRSPLVTQS